MKILVSNPDTIGDVVLRQPLLRALAAAGHELMLVVRPSVLPLVPYVAPGAGALVLPAEVYRDDVDWNSFTDLFAAARDWGPDVLVVAPYQWTRFDEELAGRLADLPGLRRVGMSGRLHAGDPYAGHAPESRLAFDVTAAVDEDLPEAEKNAALAAALLGSPPAAIDPVIEPAPGELEKARDRLAALGLEPGEYWIACVTGTAHVPIKAWPAENWAAVLRGWVERHGRRFLFVGLPDERPVAEAVRRGMGAAGDRPVVWMEPGGTLDELIALTHLSAGYVGHDTGPMHLAAAAGTPVLGVFGGGHKLRFLPRVSPSVSLTVGVPCAGCGWACSFETSHCVKAVPIEAVARAADDLEAGRVTGREARVLDPGDELLGRMVGEAARFAQRQLREAAGLSKQLRILGPDGGLSLRAERDEGVRTIASLADQLAARGQVAGELTDHARRIEAEAAALSAQLHDREAAVVELRQQLAAAADENKRLSDQVAADTAARDAEAEAARREQAAREEKARQATARRAARKSWRQAAVAAVIGSRDYTPRRRPRHLPRITLAVVLDGASEAARRATVRSVVGQHYPHLDLVLIRACGEGGGKVCAPDVQEGAATVRERSRGLPDDHSLTVAAPSLSESRQFYSHPAGCAFAAIAQAFATSDADVVGWLDAGCELEPGVLLRAGETYRDRPRAAAVYFDDTESVGGWRVPPAARPALDVFSLLASPTSRATAFFRRREYERLGPLDTTKGTAAGWNLLIRFARRYGLRRGRGHGACRPAARPMDYDRHRDNAAARASFEATFEWPGRLRCGVGHWVGQLAYATGRLARRGRLVFPPPAMKGKPLPALTPVAEPAGLPVNPVTGAAPDRLLFTGRDTSSADRRCRRVYYDSAGDVAVSYPPVGLEELGEHYAARAAAAGAGIVPPADGLASPYAGYRGGRAWERAVARLPSPYWRLRRQPPGDPAAGRLVRALRGFVRPADTGVRLLNVGCYDGGTLDRLKRLTRWQLSGTETNAEAARAAREKGHAVWETSPQDAPLALPVGDPFDVVFLSGVLEHVDDPVRVLRRLRQLLAPGGWFVFNAPNLDSKLLDLYGPTWSHWQLPYHRVFFGRRGLRQLARAADLRLARVRTHTDPYPAAASAALNAAGLAAVVPEGATLPHAAGRQGARAAGWARTLWDWRGKGDEAYVVMQAM